MPLQNSQRTMNIDLSSILKERGEKGISWMAVEECHERMEFEDFYSKHTSKRVILPFFRVMNVTHYYYCLPMRNQYLNKNISSTLLPQHYDIQIRPYFSLF